MRLIARLLLGVFSTLTLFYLILYKTAFENSREQKYTFKKGDRIFCMILTSNTTIDTRGRGVVEAWANKCDNYKLITLLDKAPTNLDIDHVLEPPGFVNDTYDRLTEKVYRSIKYIFTNYNNYDWYLKADDDTFIFVDNLRKFLADKNSSKPVTFGYNFNKYIDGGYASGGAGYVISREALLRFGAFLHSNYSFCSQNGVEDVDIAICMHELGIVLEDTIDKLGRERFHPFNLNDHYTGFFADWFYEFSKYPVKQGVECCSDTSISFHYMTPTESLRLARILDDFKNKSFENVTFVQIYNQFVSKNKF